MSSSTSRLGGLNSSLAFKAPVRVATTANISLNGWQVLDGVQLADGDTNLRVLVKNNTNSAENGIWNAQAGAWTRAKDLDAVDDFLKGTQVWVVEGSTQSGLWLVSSADPTSIDTDPITFQYSAYRSAVVPTFFPTSAGGDDTVAFQAAVNTGVVYLPNAPTTISNIVATRDFEIVGSGPLSELIFKTGSTGFMIDTGVYRCKLLDFLMTGGTAVSSMKDQVSSAANRSGLRYAADTKSIVRGLRIEGFDNYGVLTYSVSNDPATEPSSVASELMIHNCWKGFWIAPGAEFMTLCDSKIYSCRTNLYVQSGNTVIHGNVISNGYDGAVLDGTGVANNGHAKFHNNTMAHFANHCLRVLNITLGYGILGNVISVGSLWVEGSTGVQIAHGWISVGSLSFVGGGRNYMRFNYIYDNSSIGMVNTVIHNQLDSNNVSQADNTIVEDNFDEDGEWAGNDVVANQNAELANRIINGSGLITQAGLASTADGAYTGFDQWLALTQSNPITPSQLADQENGTPYMMRLTQANASAQRFGLIQPIEHTNGSDLRGNFVMLSARVRMSVTTTLRYAIVEWTGTLDAITKDIVNDWTSGTFTTGNFFKSTTTTVAATGSTAMTATNFATVQLAATISSQMQNILVFFWTDSTQAQNVTLDIGNVKFEIGRDPTPYQPRPFAQELALCQRYWETSYNYGATIGGSSVAAGARSGFGVSTTAIFAPLQFLVRKRSISPTITMYSYAGTSAKWTKQADNGDTAALDNQNFWGISDTGIQQLYSSAAGLTAGNGYYGHFVADARL